MREDIVIIGGGLAGSEAAWQAANRGAKVTLYEMRPKEQTAARPLTTDALAEHLKRLTHSTHLYFYDAISPIVDADSIDMRKVFKASRYNKGDADYLNCPMTEAEYDAFHQALLAAEKVVPKEFEKIPYFEGCIPIEVMAERGRDTMMFGPMKPVGLVDPRTNTRPYAVVQLRMENRHGTCYNLVGFQTKLTYGAQKRVLRMIPGLEHAEFLRYGSVHRNTFVNAPALLRDTLQLKSAGRIFLAGQLVGVEGYTEAAATGGLAGINAARGLQGEDLVVPPETTAHGALLKYITTSDPRHFQPMNTNYGLFPPLSTRIRDKQERQRRIGQRALEDFAAWMQRSGLS